MSKSALHAGCRLTRRAFLQAAIATGTVAALPFSTIGKQLSAQLAAAASSGGPAPLPGGPFFLSRNFNGHDLYAITEAICARIIPADVFGPGARDAGAVNYIDMFLGAFELPSTLARNPAIYLSGPYSGRWPFGDQSDGQPSASFPPDAFENGSGQIQFLGLTANQAIAWYLRIYGSLDGGPNQPPPPSWLTPTNQWQPQVTSGLIPGAQNLRRLYDDGLSAFDAWSEQNYGTPFAQASAPQQDALLFLAWNPLLAAASQNGFPGLPSPLPNPVPPPGAASLFGTIVLHTIQGTYCLPEYSGGSDTASGGQVTWQSIGFDGDTQPLGNSIYDESLTENQPIEPDNQWTNDGFGGPQGSGLYQPRGAYREHRPVSYPDADADQTRELLEEFQELVEALEKAGAKVATFVSGKTGL